MSDGFVAKIGNMLFKGKRVTDFNCLEIPKAPRISGLTTPSTITPLFGNSNFSNINKIAVIGITDPNKNSVDYDMKKCLVIHNAGKTLKETEIDQFSSKKIVFACGA